MNDFFTQLQNDVSSSSLAILLSVSITIFIAAIAHFSKGLAFKNRKA